MDSNTILKHLAWITCLMVVLQVIFHFVLQIIDYSSFLLSVILTVAILGVLIVLFGWKVLRKSAVT